ncbi:MAG: NusG domain II-containing protein [Eggerthellaceae bacterium]|nr:NusG domain II-containing protein [Eggerthellaceae bacterium]
MNDVQRGQRGIREYIATFVAILFIVVALLGGGYYLFLNSEPHRDLNTDTHSLYAIIHASDGSVTQMPLDVDGSTTISTDLGFNTISVEAGKVHIQDADCDNHDCIHQGEISHPGEQIVCLPHKLWIEIQYLDDAYKADENSHMDIGATHSHMLDTNQTDVVSR